jgi:hypothetical protein
MLIDYIDMKLTSQGCFSDLTRESIRDDLNRLRQFTPVNEMTDQSQLARGPYINDDLYDRLTGYLVAYCREHPQLIQNAIDSKQYR